MSIFEKLKKNKSNKNVSSLFAPIDGEVIKINDVPDPVFSGKLMGDGVAIETLLDLATIVAPCDAKVVSVFPGGHAIGLSIDDNTELLVHVGIDTVNLKGEGFKLKVEQGDKVLKGQPLVEVDFAAIRDKVPSTMTVLVFTKLENRSFSAKYGKTTTEQEIIKFN